MPTRSFFKNVTAKVEIPYTQQQEIRRQMRALVKPTNLVVRLFLFGWKGKDDGLFEELGISSRMAKAEFQAGTALMLRSILETRISIKYDKDGEEYTSKVKLTSRTFQAPLFGESTVGDSTWLAQPFLARLRAIGVLPLATPGLCPSERNIVVENAVNRIRSLVLCDRRTVANFSDAEKEALHVAQTMLGVDEFDNDKQRFEFRGIVKHYLRSQQESRVTLFSEENPPPYLLGDNYVPFSLTEEGSRLLLFLRRGMLASNEPYPLSYGARKHSDENGEGEMCFGEMPSKSRRNLLHKLTITDIGGDKTEYKFEFLENGKRKREAVLHEPRLQFLATKRGVELYLQIPLSGEANFDIDCLASGEKGCEFMRRWPKSVGGLSRVKNLKVLGVDLGINRVFSWAVATADCFEKGLPVNISIGEIDCSPTGVSKDLKNLRSYLRDLLKVISHTVGFKRLHLPKVKAPSVPLKIDDEIRRRMKLIIGTDTDEAIRAFVARLHKKSRGTREKFEKMDRQLDRMLISKVTDDVDSYIRNVESLSSDFLTWTGKNEWMAGEFLRKAWREFGRLTEWRRQERRLLRLVDEVAWDEIMELLNRISHRFNCIGQEFGKNERDSDFMKNFYEQRENHRLNLRKTLVRAIIDTALRYGCQAIAVENLTNLSREDRKKNHLWQMWSPNMLITNLAQAAIADGIAVLKVDPSYTSKMVYGKGLLGWRPDCERESLYYLDGGKLDHVDADKNAAKNIAYLALTRHADLWYFKFRVENGKVVPVVGEIADEWLVPQTDEERQAAEKLKAEKQAEALERQYRRLERCLGKDWQSKLPVADSSSEQMVIWHDGHFITRDERKELEEQIERLYLNTPAGASRSVDDVEICNAVSA